MTRRLIENPGFPLDRVSEQSAREKSLRKGHLSTLHLWWARRPLVMSRAVALGLLIDEPDDSALERELLQMIRGLSDFDQSSNRGLLEAARKAVRQTHGGQAPRILDPFAGGGAIPLEALRIGADPDALELNPVAYVLLLALLDYPLRFLDRESGAALDDSSLLTRLVIESASELRDAVWEKVGKAYGEEPATPKAYIWARTIQCPDPLCQAEVPILSSRLLDSRESSLRGINVRLDDGSVATEVVADDQLEGDPRQGTIRSLTVTCPCGATVGKARLREIGQTVGYGERLVAVISRGERRYEYREPTSEDLRRYQEAADLLGSLKPADGVNPWPDEEIPYSNLQVPYVYGFDNWGKYFNTRQRLVLGAMCAEVRRIHDGLVSAHGPELARATATYLGLIIDRIADRNSTFSTWTTGGQKIRNTFGQQGISNAWDYVENNPFSGGSGSWDQAVEWVVNVVRHVEQIDVAPARVVRGNAMELPYAEETFDAIITDPPYYDSVQYGDLSDFFYVWLKRSIGFLYPEHFATPQTPKAVEIVSKRLGRDRPGAVMADEYERRMSVAFSEMRRVIKPEGVAAVVFAHTSASAWEIIIRTLIERHWTVKASWPIRSEMAARSRAHGQPSLASSVCLVCYPADNRSVGFFDEVRSELQATVRSRLFEYWESGLSGADLFIAAIGAGIEVFARYERVERLDGSIVEPSTLLDLLQEIVADFALAHILGASELGHVDDVTRLYVMWRWSYGSLAVDADSAYKLGQAFGVNIDSLADRARPLVEKRRGSVVFREPDKRNDLRDDGLHIDTMEPTIDTVHRALHLWQAGRSTDLSKLLAGHEAVHDAAFWAVVQALAEVCPDGDERLWASGLVGQRTRLDDIVRRTSEGRQQQMELD